MVRKKIGIDLDTTLNNLMEHWLEVYNEEHNDNLIQWNSWDVVDNVKPECGIKILDYLLRPDFFTNLELKENAVEVIDFLLGILIFIL